MLCNVRHVCLSGARFAFNTYLHWKVLSFQFSKMEVKIREGVIQGDPIMIIICRLGVLHLIHSLQHHVVDT